MFETPKKVTPLGAGVTSTEDRTIRRSARMVSPSTNLEMMRSMPNLCLLPLEHQFSYKGYDFFEKILKLRGSQMQTFKHSLICFDEKIYLRKAPNEIIYCLAIAKGNKIKIRINFEGDEEALAPYSIDLANPALNS
jgi:hypothetical protein